MDTSKRYIQMCEVATEIQDYWKTLSTSDDDVVAGKHYKSILRWLQKGSMDATPKEDWIWIPRQDQLQEMLLDTCDFGYIISRFHDFYHPESFCPDADSEYPPCTDCQKSGKERRKNLITMEQLWLAFTMDELYRKKWVGDKWISISKPGDVI